MALDKMLQFRMGDWSANFDSMAKAPGTVYVTKNEKAMYVDVDENTRIRLGETIQLDSKEDLPAPPYSTDAYYYFAKENALMKYAPKFDAQGNKLDGQFEWKQINSLSNLDVELGNLTSRVSTLESSVATLGGEASVPGSVKEAKAAADAAQADATQALADAAAADTKAGNAATAASNAQAKANENAGLITNVTGRVATAESAIATLASTDNTKDGSVAKAQKTADDAVAAASAADTKAGNAATAAAAAQSTADGAAASASANAGEIATVKGTVSGLEGSLDTVSGKVTGLEGRMDTAEADIDALQAYEIVLKGEGEGSIKDAKKAGTDAAAVAAQNKTDIATLTGTVNGLSGSINGINGELDALEPRVKANEDNIKALQDNLGSSDDAKTEDTAFGRIAALEESLGGSSEAGSVIDRLDEAEGAIETQKEAIEGLTTSVGENADAISNIDGILGDKLEGQTGTVFELIADNSSDITDNANNIKALQKTVNGDETTVGLVQQVNTNTTGIANLKSTVDAIPKTYVSKTDYAKDKEDLATEMEEQHELIIQSINAANGMTYKKAITAYNELPTASTEEAPVRVGDTYVVANEDGFINEGTVYYSGDLLIAKGVEENGVITGSITWDHVKTGYVYKHEAKMDAVAGTDNDVAVKLTSFQASIDSDGAGDLGQFTIKGGENVKVSVNTETKVITIGMAWDTF